MDGLSPHIVTRPGQVYYRAVGRWGDGDVVSLPELSVCQWPRIPGARWRI